MSSLSSCLINFILLIRGFFISLFHSLFPIKSISLIYNYYYSCSFNLIRLFFVNLLFNFYRLTGCNPFFIKYNYDTVNVKFIKNNINYSFIYSSDHILHDSMSFLHSSFLSNDNFNSVPIVFNIFIVCGNFKVDVKNILFNYFKTKSPFNTFSNVLLANNFEDIDVVNTDFINVNYKIIHPVSKKIINNTIYVNKNTNIDFIFL